MGLISDPVKIPSGVEILFSTGVYKLVRLYILSSLLGLLDT